jgi:LmbE family N-acetylglucosaminyl deacetylase
MFSRILVLSPHADDGILGCGGSIAKFIREGKEVSCMIFSDGRPVINPSVILPEIRSSYQTLGIYSNILVEEFDTRTFDKDRQAILDRMIYVEKEIRPDCVFLPSTQDLHQDHVTICREALRAFKFSSLLGFEEPWNNLKFETRCFIQLLEEDIIKKACALRNCTSQQNRYYFSKEFSRSLACVRGTQISTQYAETFEVLRWIVR